MRLFGNTIITSMVILILVSDVTIWLYQAIYFSINNIPKIPRKKYVIISRHKLVGLNLIQKWNCAYCEYANGVLAWAKAIAIQTEIYSCAIKYSHNLPGLEYQKDFYEREHFEKK